MPVSLPDDLILAALRIQMVTQTLRSDRANPNTRKRYQDAVTAVIAACNKAAMLLREGMGMDHTVDPVAVVKNTLRAARALGADPQALRAAFNEVAEETVEPARKDL